MDNLTQRGLDYINQNKELIAKWAKEMLETEVIPNHAFHGDDTWFNFSMKTNGEPDENAVLEDTIDVNIWNDEDAPTVWKAGAYPLEEIDEKYGGGVQTNCQDFVELF